MKLTASVYGGGPFYPGSKSVLSTLNQTNFTTIICWAVHVKENGDLVYNDTPIVSGGRYIGDPTWGDQLAAVREGGSVNRILFSVGGWGTHDFTNIKNLINKFGTGPSNILYQNFAALLGEIPVIDGIDMDDEDDYSQVSIVEFSRMLAHIGYREVTFCPYMNSPFWINCLVQVEKTNPGFVRAFNLQCYAGGSYNLGRVERDWIEPLEHAMPSSFNAAAFVNPGLWCKHGSNCDQGMDPKMIEVTFQEWQKDDITGGFIWLYDDIISCGNDPRSYADAILQGLS